MLNQPRTETARAILLNENNELIFIKRTKGGETYYVFVGGGREHSDPTLIDTARREVREEIGAEITIISSSEVFSVKEELTEATLCHSFFLATTNLRIRAKNAEIDKPQAPDNRYELAVSPALASEIEKLNIIPSKAKEFLLNNLLTFLRAVAQNH